MPSSQHFTGKDVFISWVHSGGTVTLSGDQRSVTVTTATDLADSTAGDDEWRKQIATIKSISASVSILLPVGGTALEDAILAGKDGTLTVGPEGTASGKRRYVIPAISAGPVTNMPYSDVVEMSCDFSGNGTPSINTF